MCRLCEIDLTDTTAQQKTDKHCIRIENLMTNKESKFPDRDKYAKETDLLYHINQENGKEYKAVVVPKALVPIVLKEMHDRIGHFGISKTYSVIKRHYFWPKMIKIVKGLIVLYLGEKNWLQTSINYKLLVFLFNFCKSLR